MDVVFLLNFLIGVKHQRKSSTESFYVYSNTKYAIEVDSSFRAQQIAKYLVSKEKAC